MYLKHTHTLETGQIWLDSKLPYIQVILHIFAESNALRIHMRRNTTGLKKIVEKCHQSRKIV